MRKIAITLLPILFTAQACNFLFGDLYGDGGSGSRGVFLSLDGGGTWEAANRVGSDDKGLSGASVSQIVFEEGKTNNVLAATLNDGLYASDDFAKTWQTLLPNFSAHDAFINPNNSEEIFVAGSSNRRAAVYKSPDRGATWLQIYNEPSGEAAVTSLAFDRRNPAIIYASLTSGTILRTSDAGVTWNSLQDFDERIVKLALSPDGNVLYLLGRSRGLRRSQDGGRSWSEIAVSRDSPPTTYNDFALDPSEASVLYLATIQGLYRSQDTGVTWRKLLLPVTPEINDVLAVAVNPQKPQQVFAAIRSTVYRSDDLGATWRIQALPTGRSISRIAIDPMEPNRIYAGFK